MKRLSDLDVAEVSLVPRGANKKKFLIFKSRKGNTMADNEIRNLINSVDPETMKKVDQVLKSMTKMKKTKGEESPGDTAKSKEDMKKDKGGDMPPKKDSASMPTKKGKMPEAFKKDDEGGDMGDVMMSDDEQGQPLSERAQAAVKAISRIAAPFKDELSGQHIQAALKEVGFQDGAEGAEQDEKDPHDEQVHMSWAIPEGIEDEHHETALDMARKSYKDHLEKMGYRKYPDPSLEGTNGLQKSKHGVDEDDEEDEEEEEHVGKVAKSLDLSSFPKAQQEQLHMIFKSNNELVKKNADLEKELKVERDIRKMKEFEERAKSFKHLGVNSNELATIMKSLSESDTENFEKVERILKSLNNQMGQGSSLYSELGSRISKSDGNSAEAQLDTLVASVVQKSDGSKTKEMIYDEVTQTREGKKLLQQVMDEQHEAIRRAGSR